MSEIAPVVPVPMQPRKKVIFNGMNKNVVITGTVLSLLKIFQHDYLLSESLKENISKTKLGTFHSEPAYFAVMLAGIATTHSLLQKYVSDEKDPRWQTLDSLSTILAIVFEAILLLKTDRTKKSNFTKNSLMFKIISSIITITTLLGYKRGINSPKSFLALLFIEVIVLLNSWRFKRLCEPNKIGMILITLLPLLWDQFEKGKNDRDKETASTYYTVFNVMRLIFILGLIPILLGLIKV